MRTQKKFGRVWWVASVKHGVYATLGDDEEQVRAQFHEGFPALDEEPTIRPGNWLAVADLAERGYPIIDTALWKPSPNGPPGWYKCVDRYKTLQEVTAELLAYLGDDHLQEVESPLGPYSRDASNAWPEGRIVVFSVRGGSEGDWIHVGVIAYDSGKYTELLLSKTFGGREESWRTAKRIADLLGY